MQKNICSTYARNMITTMYKMKTVKRTYRFSSVAAVSERV